MTEDERRELVAKWRRKADEVFTEQTELERKICAIATRLLAYDVVFWESRECPEDLHNIRVDLFDELREALETRDELVDEVVEAYQKAEALAEPVEDRAVAWVKSRLTNHQSGFET